jgi:predicted ATP-binding protein involved in virulence
LSTATRLRYGAGSRNVVHIKSVDITNFRGFAQRHFEFAEGFNVFVGENGAGKTTALDGVAASIDLAMLVIEPSFRRPMRLSHHTRRVLRDSGGTTFSEPQYPSLLRWEIAARGETEVWWHHLRPTADDVQDLAIKFGQLRQLEADVARARNGEPVVLPLFAYYGTGRFWQSPTLERDESDAPGSRLRGYESWYAPNARVRRWLAWMKTQHFAAWQEGAESALLKAVRAAVVACVEGCVDLTWLAKLDELVLTFEDGRRVPFRDLSDGQRGLCALVGDLAFRAVELNPDLGVAAPQETPGIALIDEIDMCLHPRWQRRVVDDLRRVFPKVQFFATTHSPFIIQSLRPDELIDLDGHLTGEDTRGSIEDIAEGMGVAVPQRSERFLEMVAAAEAYYKALDAVPTSPPEERERLKLRLDELSAPFSDDPAFIAFLNVERVARGLDRLPLPSERAA